MEEFELDLFILVASGQDFNQEMHIIYREIQGKLSAAAKRKYKSANGFYSR